MRLLLAVLFTGGVLSAQVGGRAAGGVVFANPGGYGNVAYPGTGRPQAPVPFANSLGATVAGQPIPLRNGSGSGRRGTVGAYGYPVFVGGGYYDQSAYAPQQQQPNITIINNPPAVTAPAVVINQNFAAPPPVEDSPTETTHIFQSAPRRELDAAASDPNAVPAPHYFLIAYKDHSVYSALAYWIEDKTMHYVTPQQTHNQASLDLIDVDFTKKLNQR